MTAFEAGLRGVYIWIDTCRVLSPLIPFLVLKDRQFSDYTRLKSEEKAMFSPSVCREP